MEQGSGFANPIIATSDSTNFVVQPFDKATGDTVGEIIENQRPVSGKRLDKGTKTGGPPSARPYGSRRIDGVPPPVWSRGC